MHKIAKKPESFANFSQKINKREREFWLFQVKKN
jgi:hypothetical protein